MKFFLYQVSLIICIICCATAFTHGRNSPLLPDSLDGRHDKFSSDMERSHKNLNSLSRHWPKDIPFDQRFSMNRYPPGYGEGFEYCLRPAKCQPLNYTSCMGVRLPYSHTSLDLVDVVTSQEHAQELLRDWRRLIYIPKCWAVVQPFLCSLYMPRCDDGMVHLPSQEMCRAATNHCRILTSYMPWPSWFKCENSSRFPPMCKNDVPLKFNTTGVCMEPLVKTELSSYYFDGVDGCGVQCDNPMFLATQRDQIHKMIAWVASVCGMLNLFAVLTFMIDWRHSSKYPALVIFYINACFLIVCLGWLVQFLPGGREDVVCRKDGTLRTSEPSAGENLSCVVVFVMVYYFLMAGTAWFVILTYAWHLSLQALGKIQECMEKKGAYFHMIAWSIPLVLTITTMALGEIDGDSVTGICFVGNVNRIYRVVFLLGPISAVLITGAYFMSKGLITLIRLKVDSEEIISARAAGKINETILRMVVFSGLLLMFGVITFICHHYEGRNSQLWGKSFRDYILCKLGVPSPEDEHEECRMGARPSLAMLQIHILALFLTGSLMSSWVWTQTTLYTWQRYIQRLFRREVDAGGNAPKLKKHRVIAQAFAKRKMLTINGRLSISLDSTHQDPVGLKFELNSEGSGTMRSSWAAALPKFVQRRDALVATTNSTSSHRTNSIDSEISYSVRRVSVESRRHSVDSAVSVKVSEVTQTLVKKVKTPFHKKSHRTRRSRSHRRNRRHSKANGSQSSNESKDIKDLALQNISKLVMDMPKSYIPELSRRRPANVGLEGDPMAFLANQLFPGKVGSSLSSSSSGTSPPTASPKDIALDILKDIDHDKKESSLLRDY